MNRSRLPAAALLLALSGCTAPAGEPEPQPTPSTSTTRSTPTPIAAPPLITPETGSCHQLSYREAVAPSAAGGSVPCRRSHTSETFHVGRLDTVVDGRLLAVDSTRVKRQVAEACPRRLSGFLGGTEKQLRLSMLRQVWFTPTLKASDAGATWFRCDVVALTGDDTSLLPLRESLRGVLGTEAGRRRFGVCGTAEPGTDGFRRVICDRPHSWRAIRTVPLGRGDYPGEQRVRDAGEQPCRSTGRAVAEDKLDFRWGYEWPSAAQWEGGQTYGVCWVPG